MLFLGNSYTIQNDLDEAVVAVFAAAGEEVTAARLANPGWTFPQHQDAIETAGTSHAVEFAEPHTWVILQDQSQIPGFPDGNPEVEASRDAAVILDGYAAGTGAQTMFLMTWGRRDGDSTNPELYPDFLTMQSYLFDGYMTYVDLASADGTPAWVAPVGRAFERVYTGELAAGQDPLEPGNPFHALYVDDGSHPSPRGTYLAACVIYASITGRSPIGLDAPAEIADARYLQETAYAAVVSSLDIVYPWSEDPPDDTGVGDTGDDTGTGDSDDTGPGDTDDAPEDTGTDGGGTGCGCAAGPTGSSWMGLLALGLLRRRRISVFAR